MIEAPCIILQVDARRLGGTIWAIRRKGRRPFDLSRIGRTLDLGRAERFPRHQARRHAQKLIDRDGTEFRYFVVSFREADLPRPRFQSTPIQTQLALSFVTTEDLERWVLKPSSAPMESPSLYPSREPAEAEVLKQVAVFLADD